MRRAIYASIGIHAVVVFLAFVGIAFDQVSYVPREMYNVTLVSASSVQAPAPTRVVEPPQPELEAPRVEPEPEPEKPDEEMPAPPEKPQEKPKPKARPQKTVPSSEVTKTDSLPGTSPGGATSGATGPQTTGSMSFEGNFPFANYIGRMRTKIAARWEVPSGTVGVERLAVVYFRVHRDGSVSHVETEKSSGLQIFDLSCQRAVLGSSPLPPLPREYAEEYVGVHFSFTYVPSTP